MTFELVKDEVLCPLEDAGHKAYIVGGAVRDMVLGQEPNDFDVATDALPEEVLSIFKNSKYISAQFSSVVLVTMSNGTKVEVATFRKESGYINGRPTHVEYVKDIYTDLRRRDARINAMAMDSDGAIYDPLGGADDLSSGLLTCPRFAGDVIREHPIRMMRLIRFSIRFSLSLSSVIENSIVVSSHLILTERWEAISEELMKGLSLPNVSSYIDKLRELNILEHILPEVYALRSSNTRNVYHGTSTAYAHTLSALDAYSKLVVAPEPKIVLAILLHDVGKPKVASFISGEYGHSFFEHEICGAEIAGEVCTRLRLSNYDTDLITMAVRRHMDTIVSNRAARRFINRVAGHITDKDEIAKRVKFALVVRLADFRASDRPRNLSAESKDSIVLSVLKNMDAVLVTDLDVNGFDIMSALDLAEGKVVGTVLDHLLECVISGDIKNTREELINEARQFGSTLATGD